MKNLGCKMALALSLILLLASMALGFAGCGEKSSTGTDRTATDSGDGRYVCPFCYGNGRVTSAKAATYNPMDWMP